MVEQRKEEEVAIKLGGDAEEDVAASEEDFRLQIIEAMETLQSKINRITSDYMR